MIGPSCSEMRWVRSVSGTAWLTVPWTMDESDPTCLLSRPFLTAAGSPAGACVEEVARRACTVGPSTKARRPTGSLGGPWHSTREVTGSPPRGFSAVSGTPRLQTPVLSARGVDLNVDPDRLAGALTGGPERETHY